MQVIVKALEEALGHLQRDLFAEHIRAVDRSAELGAGAAARELGQLESKVGSIANARALASLAGVIPHRAVAAVKKLREFRVISDVVGAETKSLVVELDTKARATVIQALIQGRSSRDVVPDLRRKIGETAESASWQLDRTLRTGINAAVNRGHNAGYLEARELLPDLQRMGHEFLRRAEKKSGRRSVNHPISFWLHGAVADLDKPWVIDPHAPTPTGLRPVRKYLIPFPMVWWPWDGKVYRGMHYPAHVWEAGRQVPYREAWERRRGKSVMVEREATAAEGEIPQEGLKWEDWSRTWPGGTEAGTLNRIRTKGIDLVPLPPDVESPPTFFVGKIKEGGARQTGIYRKPADGKPRIEVSVTRPESWIGQPFALGKMSMVSATGKNAEAALGLTVAHERFHHLLEERATQVWTRVADAYDASLESARFVSIQAQQSPGDWFAESALAFRLQPGAFEVFDPAGYMTIRAILQDLGFE